MTDRILLEEVQKDLFLNLIEATRNLPREKRQVFMALQPSGQHLANILHPGFPGGQIKAYMGDIDYLSDLGLVRLSPSESYKRIFDVTPIGFEYYRQNKEQIAEPISRVDAAITAYLDSDRFKETYPEAYEKWEKAESIVWSDNSEQQLTVIGHFCREAMQEFAHKLIEMHKPPNADADRAHTVARIKSVLNFKAKKLGNTERPFLDALIDYWGNVNDIVQRQEHGGQKSGFPITGEDGRRVVFHTAIVMFEIDRALLRTNSSIQ